MRFDLLETLKQHNRIYARDYFQFKFKNAQMVVPRYLKQRVSIIISNDETTSERNHRIHISFYLILYIYIWYISYSLNIKCSFSLSKENVTVVSSVMEIFAIKKRNNSKARIYILYKALYNVTVIGVDITML